MKFPAENSDPKVAVCQANTSNYLLDNKLWQARNSPSCRIRRHHSSLGNWRPNGRS